MRRPLPLLLCLLLSVGGALRAEPPPGQTLSRGYKFTEQTGEALYVNVCQGCHMAKGEGAIGAGRYPALARDENLRSNGYALLLVLNGRNAMPPFGRMMNDDQIAAVVNYVRTHFGNAYSDAVTPDDVKSAR